MICLGRKEDNMKYRAAIFDMDGTILDTAGDLADAMNYALEKAGRRHDYSEKDAKNFFGSGVQVAIKRALSFEEGMPEELLVRIGTPEEVLPKSVTDSLVMKIMDIYQPYYTSHCAVRTAPYPGIRELMLCLRKEGVITAVVSNKPDEAVQTLTEEQFPGLFDLAVGLTDQVRRKPFPDVTLHAAEKLNVSVEETVYIGDSEIDLQTAVNAGMDCISVDWGFRGKKFLEECGAETIVSNTDEIFELICGQEKS